MYMSIFTCISNQLWQTFVWRTDVSAVRRLSAAPSTANEENCLSWCARTPKRYLCTVILASHGVLVADKRTNTLQCVNKRSDTSCHLGLDRVDSYKFRNPAILPNEELGTACINVPLFGGFSRGSPVSSAPSFRRCSILNLVSTSSALKTPMFTAAQIYSTQFTLAKLLICPLKGTDRISVVKWEVGDNGIRNRSSELFMLCHSDPPAYQIVRHDDLADGTSSVEDGVAKETDGSVRCVGAGVAGEGAAGTAEDIVDVLGAAGRLHLAESPVRILVQWMPPSRHRWSWLLTCRLGAVVMSKSNGRRYMREPGTATARQSQVKPRDELSPLTSPYTPPPIH
ncbi:hypothetical protein PR048_020708 [Dryococelus australis]|uniref:Uncharacterized protein n=1 Tax=Dryococelus australis TaxID=614101 RepID=A0ABQ9H709_9NEOP|nr:hypothetical protein PR048_020708 [Dryococelus australis]